jgi:hypothetical protein
MNTSTRHATLACAVLATIVGAALAPPIAQPPEYTVFVDQRAWLGVPNGFDVLSNIGFAVAGLLGLAATFARRPGRFADAWDRWPYAVLFVGVALSSVGSSFFHLAPDNARHMWDRLPMTIGFVAFLVALLAERVHRGLARTVFVPLLVVAAASVAYWYWTETQGAGDLRPYLVVQFGSLAFVALLLMLYPARGTGFIVAGLVAYVAAKGFELADRQIFEALGQTVSGHMLKHLVAAGGVASLVAMLRSRASTVPAASRDSRGSTSAACRSAG